MENEFANLTQDELETLKRTEIQLSTQSNQEVILVAYKGKQNL
jgi:hypothetical protein